MSHNFPKRNIYLLFSVFSALAVSKNTLADTAYSANIIVDNPPACVVNVKWPDNTNINLEYNETKGLLEFKNKSPLTVEFEKIGDSRCVTPDLTLTASFPNKSNFIGDIPVIKIRGKTESNNYHAVVNYALGEFRRLDGNNNNSPSGAHFASWNGKVLNTLLARSHPDETNPDYKRYQRAVLQWLPNESTYKHPDNDNVLLIYPPGQNDSGIKINIGREKKVSMNIVPLISSHLYTDKDFRLVNNDMKKDIEVGEYTVNTTFTLTSD